MRPQTLLEDISEEKRKGGRTRLIIGLLIFAHAVFYFALSLYLPFSLDELFTLGYTLLLADIGILTFLGVKLLRRRAGDQGKR